MKDIDEQQDIAEINKLHQELQELATDALDRAIHLGELLSKAKNRVPHGQWLPWLTRNVAFSDRTARNYMRIFENRAALKSANVSDLGEAYQLLVLQSQSAIKTDAAPMTRADRRPRTKRVMRPFSSCLRLMEERREVEHSAFYQLWPLVDRNYFLPCGFAYVFCQRPIKPVIFELLEHLGAPARTTRNRKDRREKIGRNP